MGNGRGGKVSSSRSVYTQTTPQSTYSNTSTDELWQQMFDNAKNITWDDKDDIQRQMGMTGDEFGKTVTQRSAWEADQSIVQSSMSFAVNCVLNGVPLPAINTFSRDQIDAMINKINKAARPIPMELTGIRSERAEALAAFLGDKSITEAKLNNMIQTFKNDPQALNDFNKVLKGIDFHKKGNTAFGLQSKNGNIPSMTNDRNVRLEVVTEKGLKGCVTNNNREHEVILTGNIWFKFGEARVEHMVDNKGITRDQLVIKTILTNKRGKK